MFRLTDFSLCDKLNITKGSSYKVQSTFPGADIGRSSPLRAMPYRVMVAHFQKMEGRDFWLKSRSFVLFYFPQGAERANAELKTAEARTAPEEFTDAKRL